MSDAVEINWYLVRLKKCGCLVSSAPIGEHQRRWMATKSFADIYAAKVPTHDGYAIMRRVEEAAQIAEFCAEHKPKAAGAKADDAQGSLFG